MRAFSTWSAIAFAALASSLFTGCDDDKKAVAPSITAPASPLANGIVGTAITPIDFVTSGTAPITFSVSAGIVPPGLTLDAMTGRLSGTPTLAGQFEFTITATNRKGSDDASYMQVVAQRPAITTPPSPLAAALGGVPFLPVTFEASGSMPITWSITAGALPPGMSLNATTGAYAGTPTAAGDYSFTVTATNAAGNDSDAYTQQVTAPAANAHVLINGNSIAAVATTFPSGLEAPLPLTGLNTGDTLVSIDRRPQNGFLYGLGYNAGAGTVQLYSISSTTGISAPIGATGTFIASDGVTPVPVGAGAGTTFGMDFNPTVDRVRVVNSAGQNFRINPNNGAFVDGTAGGALNMDGGINGPTSGVQETAYTNNAANSTVTTQYTLDLTTDALCIQNPPNAGTQTLCQTLSSPVDAVLGFDIAPGVNVAAASTPANGSGVAVLKLAGQTAETLAQVNLTTGAVASLGAIGTGGMAGLAIHQPAAVRFVGLSADGTQLLRFSSATPGSAVERRHHRRRRGRVARRHRLSPANRPALRAGCLRHRGYRHLVRARSANRRRVRRRCGEHGHVRRCRRHRPWICLPPPAVTASTSIPRWTASASPRRAASTSASIPTTARLSTATSTTPRHRRRAPIPMRRSTAALPAFRVRLTPTASGNR